VVKGWGGGLGVGWWGFLDEGLDKGWFCIGV
jgi:hypothetical protein